MQDVFNRVSEAWTNSRAWDWYHSRPRPFGVNYLPSYACNPIEMWMPETFNLDTIRRELRWVGEAGFNCIRVFLPYCEWKRQQYAFLDRMEIVLDLARSSGLTVIPVLFDDRNSAGLEPYDGWQPEPRPLVRNGCWTASPGSVLADTPAVYGELCAYVRSVLEAYREDERILFWDLYNEPGSGGRGAESLFLLEYAFRWARACKPVQPLTAGMWAFSESACEHGQQFCEEMCRILSDFISFHWYGGADGLAELLERFEQERLPVVCTEWFERQNGEDYVACLPKFDKRDAGCVQWGFVNGRTQTHIPPDWNPDFGEPAVWYQDNVRPDGEWYNHLEKDRIRAYRARCARSAEGAEKQDFSL